MVNGKTIFITIVLLLGLITLGQAKERRSELASSLSQGCVVYYGPEPADKSPFANARVIILESKHWSTRSLQRLRSQGKTVIAYLSVGETADNPVNRRDYRYLSRNADWKTLRLDPRDPAWRNEVRTQARLRNEAYSAVRTAFLDAHTIRLR